MDNSNYDERSAGGIVYRLIGNQIHWLLIKTLAKKTLSRLGELAIKLPTNFPKATSSPTSLSNLPLSVKSKRRGVSNEIVAKIGSNDYILWDKNSGTKIIKKVTFSDGISKDSSLKYSDREIVLKREWLTLEEALKNLAIILKKFFSKKLPPNSILY